MTTEYLFLAFFVLGVFGAFSSGAYAASKTVACGLPLIPPMGLVWSMAYC
jgi:hypothetical protein